MTSLFEFLYRLDLCEPAKDWVDSLSREMTPQEMFDRCPRGDWLLYVAQKLDIENDVLLPIVGPALERAAYRHAVEMGEWEEMLQRTSHREDELWSFRTALMSYSAWSVMYWLCDNDDDEYLRCANEAREAIPELVHMVERRLGWIR